MSNDVPKFPPLLPAAELPGPVWRVPEPPPRFQHVLWKHVLLFLLTLATTTYAGALHYLVFLDDFGRGRVDVREFGLAALLRGELPLGLLAHGLYYSVSILAILGAHEMGHYLACRRHKVDATLPYFIPLALPYVPPLTGTLGAVIRIREAFPTRAVLFDIGVAGPIAGFVMLVGVFFAGLSLSSIVAIPPDATNLIYFGEPLLFKFGQWIMFGPVPADHTLHMHPMVFAAWFGMLATALNLLPFGQFDGGHITYAALGRWSTPISIAMVVGAVAMSFITVSWRLITVVMVLMVFVLGARHPRVIYEHEELGPGRKLVALVALAILVLCFMPVPVR